MSADYFAAEVQHDGRGLIIGTDRYDTYDEAMRVHVGELERNVMQDREQWRRTVLLDTASVNVTNEAELRKLLNTDPLLHAIFHLGRQSARVSS